LAAGEDDETPDVPTEVAQYNRKLLTLANVQEIWKAGLVLWPCFPFQPHLKIHNQPSHVVRN